MAVDLIAVARCRCRRSPARDAAARRARGRPAWPLPDGRRWRTRRIRRGIYRTCELSNMRFECPLVSGPQRRDVPGTQRSSPLPDLHTCLNCNADYRSFDTMSFGNLGHLLRVRRSKSECATGLRGTARTSGRRSRIEIDLRADLAGPKRALGQRHGQAAVAQIVRRFGQARRRRSRGSPPARAFRSPYRARAAVPTAASELPWRTACRRSARRRTVPSPPSSMTARPGLLETEWSPARAVFISPTMPITGVG